MGIIAKTHNITVQYFIIFNKINNFTVIFALTVKLFRDKKENFAA